MTTPLTAMLESPLWTATRQAMTTLTKTELSPHQVATLASYLLLLEKWNPSHGLLATQEIPRLFDRHLIDSASLAPLLPEQGQGIDFGSGNGFPAMVLAVIRPDLQFQLCESNQKKCRFLHYAVQNLGLSHCTLHEGRIEQLPEAPRYAFATSRAFASLLDNGRLAHPLLAAGGSLLVMKGFHVEPDLAIFADSVIAQHYLPPVAHLVSRESTIIQLTKR